MAEYDGLSPGQILTDASVANFISDLGKGIADAQKALDENSVNQIAEFIEPHEGLGGKTLLDLGLSPAFYHFQHADIACSLQLSLRVEKDLSLGLNLNGSFNDTTTDSGSSSASETSTESGSSTRTQTRQASLKITSASAGALTVGGQNFALSGGTPAERIRNLQAALTGDPGTGVARVLYQLQPTALTITTDADEDKVQVTPNTVAFLSGGFDSGIIRIESDANTDYRLDTSPAVVTATTTAQGSVSAYAEHVKTQVESQGYRTALLAPDRPIDVEYFDTGKHELRDSDRDVANRRLLRVALAIKRMNLQVTIEGFTDKQPFANRARSDELNRQLGDNRAREVRNILIANGAPATAIRIITSRGDADAQAAAGPADNQDFRKAEIRVPSRTNHWLFVYASDGGPNLSDVEPDKMDVTSTGNGFIYLYRPTTLSLSGKKATIEGVDFPFSGAPIGGFASGSPEAYAKKLADDINGHATVGLKASNSSNVVTVSKDGDKFNLTLVTAETRQISISGTSGITVTTQFSRTRSTSQTRQNTGNRTVAVGASLDVRYSRQFEMNVTGNSSISARLVSIPAPPQFLETIREFLKQDG